MSGGRRALALLAVLLLLVPNLAGPGAAAAAAAQPGGLIGTLVVLWGDGPPGLRIALPPLFLLVDDKGAATEVSLSPAALAAAGGLDAVRNRRVVVTGAPGPAAFEAQSLQLAQEGEAAPAGAGAQAVTGPQPWISILCKFSDVSAEPQNLAYFQGMYSSNYPGLDHYWREQSFNQINVTGSNAVGWFTLPQPRSSYVYGSPLRLDHARAATDCTAVADAQVHFPSFVGINLMFNDHLDGYAWGGSYILNRDGVNKLYFMTWEPPWGYNNVTVIAHEMGHGFGLPHSSGPYGQIYDNRWDVMSDTWSGCSLSSHTTYGCLGQHTISYHKDRLGWVAAGKRYVAAPNSQATIALERLALPQTADYLMARIPIGGSSTRYYTVEVRQRVGYDIKLPDPGVIIHEVNLSWGEPAHVVDSDGNRNTGDAGAIWLPGETFTDAANGVKVCVLSATSTGYVVTIGLGPAATCSSPASFPYNIFVPYLLR